MTDRKARLAALAAKAGRNNTDNNNSGAEEDRKEAVAAGLKFRNYTPVLLPTLHGADDEEPRAVAPPPKKARTNQDDGKKDGEPSVLEKALEKARKDAAAAASSSSSSGEPHSSATTNIETKKKINWDLKRDIQPKLDRLERRTQKAIVALLKQRLENEAAAAAPSSASALD